jgi:lysyl-tRNA synthetase class II
MSELDEQIKNRREKRAQLAEAGVATYPHRFDWDLEPSGIHSQHEEKDRKSVV